MINPSELTSYSQRRLGEQHQRADMDSLAKIATGQIQRVSMTKQFGGWVRQVLNGLIARWRFGRAGHVDTRVAALVNSCCGLVAWSPVRTAR